MKASGTAAKAREDSAHRKAPAAKPGAKPTARAQAKSVPAVVKKAAKPVAARAAATAVATKTAPVAKPGTPKPAQPVQATEAPAKPAAAPAGKPTPAAAKQPPAAKPAQTAAAAKRPADAPPSQPATAAKHPADASQTQPAAEAKRPAEGKAAAGKASPPAEHASARPTSEGTAASPAGASSPAMATETPATAVQGPAAAVAAHAPTPPAPAAPPPAAGAAAPAQPAPRPPSDATRRPGTPGMHTGPITAPRILAKAEVFHEGDHVVYPTHGVGKVERIATEEIAGHKLELIHITFEENRMTLRVPVAKARTAGLRKLATRKLFEEALNVLKGRARIKRTMWSRRAQEYEAKINSGDPLAIAEVVRDLHRNAGQPDQSFSERQIYEAAMERLAAELAALDKTDKATAATKLTDFLKTV